MEDLTVRIEGFDGPLDLLLHLIQQYEMDIYQVPLAEVTDQYLAYLNTMQTLQLEVAGEYLVMAATLLAIKSRQLLPTNEDVFDELEEDDPEDIRNNLIQQLIEYRRYKYAANQLKEEESQRLEFYDREPEDLTPYDQERPLDLNQVTTIDLFLAFHDVLQKAKNNRKNQATIEKEDVSVADKVIWLKEHLFEKEKKAKFSALFKSSEKQEVVNTFLAVLELMKEGFVIAQQEDTFSEIYFIPKGEVD